MKVNFDIIDNYAIEINGRLIDLHNNFDFVGFDYRVVEREITLHWKKSKGDWVNKHEISNLMLTHIGVSFLEAIEHEQNSIRDEKTCLSEITFFPSAEREIDDCFIPKRRPNSDDDIIYFFVNGLTIKIHCEQVELNLTL
ncbi:MAG: hypothetical protein INR69_09895 [Mucilaginibacter polytrichastri]|nr:hypothetical protein [Mucilaginibacter polytrichastri]